MIGLGFFQRWVKAGWSSGRNKNCGRDIAELRDLAIQCMGLPGEVGEVLELIKKEVRGDGPLDREKLKLELGDVQHYLCRIASTFDIDMYEVLEANVDKIETRRGKRAFEVA